MACKGGGFGRIWCCYDEHLGNHRAFPSDKPSSPWAPVTGGLPLSPGISPLLVPSQPSPSHHHVLAPSHLLPKALPLPHCYPTGPSSLPIVTPSLLPISPPPHWTSLFTIPFLISLPPCRVTERPTCQRSMAELDAEPLQVHSNPTVGSGQMAWNRQLRVRPARGSCTLSAPFILSSGSYLLGRDKDVEIRFCLTSLSNYLYKGDQKKKISISAIYLITDTSLSLSCQCGE